MSRAVGSEQMPGDHGVAGIPQENADGIRQRRRKQTSRAATTTKTTAAAAGVAATTPTTAKQGRGKMLTI